MGCLFQLHDTVLSSMCESDLQQLCTLQLALSRAKRPGETPVDGRKAHVHPLAKLIPRSGAGDLRIGIEKVHQASRREL